MNVTLTWYEVALAGGVGIRRYAEAVRRSRLDKYGFSGHPLMVHVEGALGEMAYAKAAGVYWDGSVDTFKHGGDVGAVHVRTRSRHDYDLIVRADDDPDAIYVLVTGSCPSYLVRGWIRGRDAHRDEWQQRYGSRPPAFFVPAELLNPFTQEEAA